MIKNYPKLITSIIALLICNFIFSQSVQDNEVQIIETPICTMPATDIINEYKVLRSEFVKQQMDDNSSRNNCSTFVVSYFGFENVPEAQTAFQFAVDIWQSLLVSDVTIRIEATFADAAPSNLGSARSAFFAEVPTVPTNPNAPVLYPAALFEKLTGEDSGGFSTDIICNFNRARTDWYFGTDGNPPRNQFDFVTVVLHEIGHGLGVAGFGIENPTGQGRIRRDASGITISVNSEHVSVWDTYVQGVLDNNQQAPIITEDADPNIGWEDPSSELLTEFQSSGSLTCFAPTAVGQNGGAFVNLFAPSPFQGGSSYSHLDESTFSNTPNGLMTPFAARGEVNHDPGPVILGFMEDMGWSLCAGSLSTNNFTLENTKISPNPFTESLTINLPSEVANQEFDVTIVDINGRIVSRNSEATNGEIIVTNLENLRSALYFLTIESKTSDLSITKKIIKQ